MGGLASKMHTTTARMSPMKSRLFSAIRAKRLARIRHCCRSVMMVRQKRRFQAGATGIEWIVGPTQMSGVMLVTTGM